jgi:signal transduction histidine kinase
MTMPLHDPLDPLLLETLEEGVVEFRGSRILRANPAFARLVGLAVEKLEGRNASDFFAEADGRPLESTQLQEATRLRDAGGSLRPVSVRRVSADRVVVVDRSREQRLEQQIWQLSSRLQSQAGSEAEPVLCDEVSSMVEHEIRTSSTVVRGYLRMLLDGRPGPLTGEQAGFLREARREAERIESLVDDLLDLAASDGPRELRVALKPARLHPVIHQAVAAVHPLLEDRGLAVNLDLALEDDSARLDSERMERVLVNVLANAARHSPPNATLSVATHLVESGEGASISISVLDEGPGVSHGDAERIFDPFVRGGAEIWGDPRGVGLGLAFCRRILEAHGGRIVAIAGLGYGLFRISLPLEE